MKNKMQESNKTIVPKIMLVDDDVDIAEVVELILNRNGFEVVKIYDGRKILETIENFKPDVILLDVNIADIDGREVCKELKASDSPHNHIPIVLFSAMHDLRLTFPECQATDFISKPFNSRELVSKLKKYSFTN